MPYHLETTILHDEAVDDALDEAIDEGLCKDVHPFGVMVEDLARLALRNMPGTSGEQRPIQQLGNLSPVEIADKLRRIADDFEGGA